MTKPIRMIAGLMPGLLFAILAVPLGAQPVPESHVGRGFGPYYNAAHEITFTGDIQAVVTKHVVGSPIGMHVAVAGPKGLVDAHLGPFLSKETREALHVGTPVEIVGAMATQRGKNYFLAREVTVGGSTIAVRNIHGVLLRPEPARVRPTRVVKTAKVQANGGAR